MVEINNNKRRKFLFRRFFNKYLNLDHSKENEEVTIAAIRSGVEFKGTNLWVLIFATFIASLGLNVNSTAVIIGAMLISPLMGPIMGVGMAIGLNDFELMKRSLKNYLIATLFSVVTATVYFLFTPLNDVQSELLARTSPSIYDVFIALVGGMAGIVAVSTKEKGNVIPGVAIATALMPPLCTAGFGLATGNWLYFLGAFYLYFINSVFISLATFIGVRVMHFRRKQFMDKAREKVVRQYIVCISILTMCPAVYLTYGIVRETFYVAEANKFISSELCFPDCQIMNREISFVDQEIKVVLIGNEVSEEQLETIRLKMGKYKLKNSKLTVFQGANNQKVMDISNIKSLVMEDFYKNSKQQILQQQAELDSLYKWLSDFSGSNLVDKQMGPEMKILFPCVRNISVSKTMVLRVDSACTDTLTLAWMECKPKPSKEERQKIFDWLKARTGDRNLKLVVE